MSRIWNVNFQEGGRTTHWDSGIRITTAHLWHAGAFLFLLPSWKVLSLPVSPWFRVMDMLTWFWGSCSLVSGNGFWSQSKNTLSFSFSDSSMVRRAWGVVKDRLRGLAALITTPTTSVGSSCPWWFPFLPLPDSLLWHFWGQLAHSFKPGKRCWGWRGPHYAMYPHQELFSSQLTLRLGNVANYTHLTRSLCRLEKMPGTYQALGNWFWWCLCVGYQRQCWTLYIVRLPCFCSLISSKGESALNFTCQHFNRERQRLGSLWMSFLQANIDLAPQLFLTWSGPLPTLPISLRWAQMCQCPP